MKRFMVMVLFFTIIILSVQGKDSYGINTELGKSRKFEFTYKLHFGPFTQNGQELEIWIPVASDEPEQSVMEMNVESPYPTKLVRDEKSGNRLLYLKLLKPKPAGFDIKIKYTILRREVTTDFNSPPLASAYSEGAQKPDSYLAPSKYAVVSDSVKKLAERAVAGKTTKTEKARAIYDFILSNMQYNKEIPGWGKGDVARLCLAIDGGKSGTGNCTDFHSLFASMMQSQGIPVMFEMGFPLKTGGITKPQEGGYHCWAKFYIEGTGWIPVDISEASKDRSKTEYFWGSICENRILFSRGRDINLIPPQKGEPLNFFGPDPYVEIDGKSFDGFTRSVSYKDVR